MRSVQRRSNPRIEIDFSPRVLWCVERNGHLYDCVLMPFAQHFAVMIGRDGQARDAEGFAFQPDALPVG